MATAADIQNWFRNNPGATDAQIYAVMQENNVTPEALQQAMGFNLAELQQRYNAAQTASTPTSAITLTAEGIQNWFKSNPGATDAQIEGIQNWFKSNPGATDAQIYAVMQRYNAAQNPSTPTSPAGTGNAATPTSPPGTVTAADIQNWFRSNPGATDEQIYTVMQQNKVSPEAVQQAMGFNMAEFQQRYAAQQAAATPIGLAGYEQAAEKGLSGATSQLQSTLANINNLYGINITDLQNAAAGARGDITKGYDDASGYITTGYDDARGDITKGYGEARGYVQPFYQGGQTAYQQQMALSGALGQDAFNAARQESPYEKFLFEQGMRSNLAGASATGGLGGGNVQKELQRFGQGLASQGLQQQIGNLNTLSGYGMQSASALGNLATGEAGMMGNLATGRAGMLGNLATGRAGALADIGLNTAQNIASGRSQQAGFEANVGTNIAQMRQNTGQNIASNRMSVAEMIARQQENAALQQANMLESQGINMSNLYGTQGQNLINLGQNAYNQYIQDVQNEAMTQADLYREQGNVLGGQPFAQAQLAQADLAQPQYAQPAGFTQAEFAQAPPTNYSGMVSDAFSAAGTGYELGRRMQTPIQRPQEPYFSGRNPSPSYRLPGGQPSYNYLSGAGLKKLVGGG